MINTINDYKDILSRYNFDYFCPKFEQTLSENQLLDLIGNYDAWIIGDDPATKKVFQKGKSGKLKVAMKWGVGTDNVDFKACDELNIPINNTPQMFGEEVSDVAIGYLLCLTRKLHLINNENLKGNWFKPLGNSLSNKKVCLIGFGDIGRCIARKLFVFNLNVYTYDPGFEIINNKIVCKFDDSIIVDDLLQKVKLNNLDTCLDNSDYIIVACPLNKNTKYLLNKEKILKSKKGVYIINISRGGIINENDVNELQENEFINGIAFDVFENEPLDKNHNLKKFPQNMFGSHNGSNTIEAVNKVSLLCIEKIYQYFKENEFK